MAIDVAALTTAYPGWKSHWGFDEFLFSAQGNSIDHSRKADKVQASGFGQRVQNNLSGMQEGSLKIKGLANMTKGQLNWVINQRMGRVSPINAWFATQGLDPLSPITLQPSSIIDSSISAKLKDAVDFSLELDARGAFNDGVILLSPNSLITTASGTGNTDDNTTYGGATTNGGVGQLHVWAIDGGTSPSVTITIQHSPDGTTWTNLVSFTAMTAIGSQRIQLPSTTTVNQKLQATWTTTGSPTDVQVLAAFSRGVNLNV